MIWGGNGNVLVIEKCGKNWQGDELHGKEVVTWLLHYDGDDLICSTNGGTSQVMELGGRWPQRLLFQHEVVRRIVTIIASNDESK